MMTLVFWKKLFLLIFICSISNGYKPQRKEIFDYIVAGGGTAGCVVASRLSEDPRVQVLLLEAGISDRSIPAVQVPGAVGKLIGSKIDWGFLTEPLKYAGKDYINRQQRMSQGKVLGGRSSMNNIQMVRGSPYDYERWRYLGNKGWGYKNVLHYFKKFEDIQDPHLAKSKYHGTKGPVNIVVSERTPLTNTLINAGRELGYKEIDYNGKNQEGFSLYHINTKMGRRQSTAEAYIWSVRGRRNLHVKLQATVTKVIIRNKTAVGVQYVQHGRLLIAYAKREVIITAGALNTPKILMLSGIGPIDHLLNLGISVVKDLPVGLSMNYHIATYLDYFLDNPPSNAMKDLHNYVYNGTGPLTQSGHEGVAFLKLPKQPKKDKYPHLQLGQTGRLPGSSKECIRSFLNWNLIKHKVFEAMYSAQLGKQGVEIAIVLTHPRTTGTVTLKSKNPFMEPRFIFPALKDSRDVRDLVDGIRIVQKLMLTTPYKQLNATLAFPKHPGCREFQDNSDEYWSCFVRYNANIWLHYSSTCKMAPDATGVVDNKFRVKGIYSLRVADASIMPQMTSGQAMAAVIMCAEKAADMIKWDNGVVRGSPMK